MLVRKKLNKSQSENTDISAKGTDKQTDHNIPVSGSEETEGGERVDQIRDILFGAQRQEYERRFSRQEELLVKNISELSSDTANRFIRYQQENDKKFSRLEELLVNNISAMSHEIERKIDSNQGENEKRFRQLEENFHEAIADLKKETGRQFDLQKSEHIQKLNSLEDKFTKAMSDVNKRFDSDVASLIKDIDATKTEFVRGLEQLDSHKMDRNSLAKFLHNAAAGIEGKEHKTESGAK